MDFSKTNMEYDEIVRLVDSGGVASGVLYECPKCGYAVHLPEDVGVFSVYCPGSIRGGQRFANLHGACMLRKVK